MDAYNLIAAEWEASRKAPFPALKLLLPEISRRDRILDAGCGNGRNLVAISSKCHEAYGIDSSNEMLKNARERLAAKEVKNAAVVDGNILNLPFADSFFDKVFCIAVLHHLKGSQQSKALGEFWRVLCEGGELCLTVWSENRSNGLKERLVKWRGTSGRDVDRYYYFFRRDELCRLIRNAGFKIIDSFDEKGGAKVGMAGAVNFCVLARKIG